LVRNFDYRSIVLYVGWIRTKMLGLYWLSRERHRADYGQSAPKLDRLAVSGTAR